MLVAADIGNSETKMYMDDFYLSQPSVVKRVTKMPPITETEVKSGVANLMNDLVVHISSDAIKRNGTYIVGRRASKTANQVENMNIKISSKNKHDIPLIMTLSMIAARSIQLHYEENEELPQTLEVDSKITTAIPASEYSPEKVRHLESRLSDHTHVLIMYVGETQVTVLMKFSGAKVTQEGVPALYTLVSSDDDILDLYHKQYGEKVNTNAFTKLKILHADIGDGTTEYVYTDGMNAIHDICSGQRRGVGHATEEAVLLLKDEVGGNLEINRQQFMQMHLDPTNKLHELAVRFMAEARFSQAQKILEDIQEKYIADAASNVDVIMVYGGGSIQFFDDLYDELLDFAEEVNAKVLWIPENYAVNMNVDGLKTLNDKVLYAKG